MIGHDSHHDDGTDSQMSRRAFVAAGGGAAASALAGCQHGSSGPDPDVTLEDVRVVQTVEDTNLETGTRTVSDPPIVAGEYATVMFDLSVDRPDDLPETMSVAVTSNHHDVGFSMTLHRSDVQAIDGGADAPAVFHETANSSGPGEAPPVFEMPESPGDITVKVVSTAADGDEVTLTEGEDGDFEVTELQTLRVGFIPIKDPGSTPPEYHYHGDVTNVHVHSTDLSWGDANGESKFYERSVASSFEYLKRAFPGQVVGYRHDSHMVGHISEDVNNAATKDAEEALKTLNQIRCRSSFPSDGTVLTEDLTRSEAIDLMDASSGGAFDAHVLICPRGTGSGNNNYFTEHWSSNPPAGYHYHFDAAVASHEAADGGDDVWHSKVTAQEIGHRFAQPVYDGAIARSSSDRMHADGDLVSTGYDLTDGSYSLITDWSVADGNFSNGSPLSTPSGPGVRTLQSYMSGTGADHWADSRVHRYYVDGEYEPGFGDGSASPSAAAGTQGDGDEIGDVVQAFGALEDGHVQFHDAATYQGVPRTTTYDPDRDVNATPVDVQLVDPAGEVLASATVPDRHGGSHAGATAGSAAAHGSQEEGTPVDGGSGDGHVTHETVAVTLPFPVEGVSLVADRDGNRTSLNPIVAPIQYALDGVPDAPLVEGEETLSQLFAILHDADELMSGGEYRDAADLLDGEFVAAVGSGLQPYEAHANEPDPERLQDLARDMAERLHTVADRMG